MSHLEVVWECTGVLIAREAGGITGSVGYGTYCGFFTGGMDARGLESLHRSLIIGFLAAATL